MQLNAVVKKEQLQIKVKDKSEMRATKDTGDEGHFIIQLDGSMNRIVCVNLRVDHEARAILASTRISITQNTKKSALFKPESIEIRKSIDFSELPESCFESQQKIPKIDLQAVAKFAESEMTVQQRPNGQYDLVAKEWLSSTFKEEKEQYKSPAHHTQKGASKATRLTKTLADNNAHLKPHPDDAKIKF